MSTATNNRTVISANFSSTIPINSTNEMRKKVIKINSNTMKAKIISNKKKVQNRIWISFGLVKGWKFDGTLALKLVFYFTKCCSFASANSSAKSSFDITNDVDVFVYCNK